MAMAPSLEHDFREELVKRQIPEEVLQLMAREGIVNRSRLANYIDTRDEIQGILSHAGSGCPLGPCQGCPHSDVRTGACLA